MFFSTVLVVNMCSSCKAKGGLGNGTGHGPFLIDYMENAVLILWDEKLRCRDANYSMTQQKWAGVCMHS